MAASKSSSHPSEALVRSRSGAPRIATGTMIAVSTTSSSEIPSVPLRHTRPNEGAIGWVAVFWNVAPFGS